MNIAILNTPLYSPDSAPKDGRVILGRFVRFHKSYMMNLHAAAWNINQKAWMVAIEEDGDFLSYRFKPEELHGWLPMPTIRLK